MHLALLGFFLGGVGNDDTALIFCFRFLDALDDQPVVEWANLNSHERQVLPSSD